MTYLNSPKQHPVNRCYLPEKHAGRVDEDCTQGIATDAHFEDDIQLPSSWMGG